MDQTTEDQQQRLNELREKANLGRPATVRDVSKLADVLSRAIDDATEVIGEEVAAVMRPIVERVALLEAQQAEQSKSMHFVGVWESATYNRGAVVVCKSGLWHCEAPTTSRPGTDSTWRLIVKGRHG